jgi:hypothetical protein
MIISSKSEDYICITDIAKSKWNWARAADIVKNWIRTRSTLEFLWAWEQLYNPNFKVVEFDHFKMQAWLPSFVLSPWQWAEKTNAVGIYTEAGKYWWTFAHKDIAFEFASAINPIFKLFLIKEFQRLKETEQKNLSLEWNLTRTLAKVNYRIHTDAIKEYIIPPLVTAKQVSLIYASEADILNVALFWKTAIEWRKENPKNNENIRDSATLEQLVVLSNMESINALLIRQWLSQKDRLLQLNNVAITQIKSLLNSDLQKKLR